MSIWYDGNDLHMFQGDTGSLLITGLPTDKVYKLYFAVKSTKSSDILFEVVSDVESMWFDKNGLLIEKLKDETDDEYLNRVIELSLKEPREAYHTGCSTIYISSLLSNKLNVRNGEHKHEYYYSLKLCDEFGDIQNTILPKVSLDEKGAPVFQDPVKIVVRPKYVQVMYNCKSKYDTAPEIVYMPLDVNVLDKLNINVESASSIVDYIRLSNKPKINGVELVGNKTALELGLVEIGSLTEYVSVNSQTFTDEQQTQARENIGANQLYGEIDPTVLTKAKYIGQLYVNTTSRKIFYCYDIKDGQYYWNHFSQTFVKEINIPPEDKTISIQHNMNCYPNVKILDNSGDNCFANILFNDEDKITISFDVETFIGRVLLNY
jgi:hypothetical protein